MARDERAKQLGIPSIVDAQRDFSLGQIDWDARKRDDTKFLGQALKNVTNFRPLPAGGLEVRPGTENVKFYTQAGRVAMIRAQGKKLHTAVFLPTVVEFLNESDALVSSLSGAPWNGADLDVMRWTQAEDTFVVVGNGWQPQVLAYNGSNWNRSNFNFREERSGAKRQAYYRFEADGVTMKPSARGGTIQVDFSTGFLVAGHVGARFRYGEREVQVTSIVNSSRCNANVIDQLPISLKIWVKNTRGLRVGDRIQGSESGAYGEVTNIDTGSPENIKVTLYRAWGGFERDEFAVGPNWRSQIIAPGDGSNRDHQEVIDPEPITSWDEQFMSAARGWPGAVGFVANRLAFSAFPQVPNAVLLSAPTLLTDFLVGPEPGDAILELIPGNVEVYDLVDFGDVILSTNAGIYHIPLVSLQSPGATQFRKIGSDGVTNTAPAVTSEGVAFLSAGKNRVIAVQPQDDEEHPYKLVEITELHREIVKVGSRVVASSGDAAASGRFVYLLKGTLGSITMGRPTGDAFGWFPWTFAGDIRDVAAYGAELRYLVKYANSVFGLERVVESATLDGQIPLTQSSKLQQLQGMTMTVVKDGKDMGNFVVAANGSMTGYSGGNSGAVAGFGQQKKILKVPSNVDSGRADGQRSRRRRKVQSWVDVNNQIGGLTFEDRTIPDYDVGENQNQAPVSKDQLYTRRQLGRKYELEVEVRMEGPRTMKVLEIGVEATI